MPNIEEARGSTRHIAFHKPRANWETTQRAWVARRSLVPDLRGAPAAEAIRRLRSLATGAGAPPLRCQCCFVVTVTLPAPVFSVGSTLFVAEAKSDDVSWSIFSKRDSIHAILPRPLVAWTRTDMSSGTRTTCSRGPTPHSYARSARNP
jgi:hypothetical protein